MPRGDPRTSNCGSREAKTRLAQARHFLKTAEQTAETQGQDATTPSVVAALAVLAGIAASDSACCLVLGQRPRGEGPREATALLSRAGETGPAMARNLARLLEVKDEAQYGVTNLTAQKAGSALRQAQSLVQAAASLVYRPARCHRALRWFGSQNPVGHRPGRFLR